jgi:hypothetical protein
MITHPFFNNAQKVIPASIYKKSEKLRDKK